MKKILSCLLLAGVAHAVEPPNVVFILTDDMSWVGTSVEMMPGDDETKSDFYQTPNIENLAEQGMRFSNAYSPASLCTPSRAAILTGKTPAELHMTTPGSGQSQAYNKLAVPQQITDLPTSETTVAEALKKEGYATAHFGKWHLGRGNPGDHGFDEHDGSTGNASGGTDDNPKDVFGLTERAFEFMTDHADEPFYLQLSHYAVHVPVQALEESTEKFSRVTRLREQAAGEVRKGDRHTDVDFAAMTWDLDTSIGILLEKIDELGLGENTYVVLMSDNGGASTPRSSQNLPLSGGKGTLSEGGIRVPLIVRGPGIEADTVCGESVTGCDLFPTFCEWANVPVTEEVEGVSLIPLLTGSGTFQRSDAVLFHYPHYGHGPSQKPQSAVIVENYKLIREWESGTVQLFDLENDLSEKNDLSKKLPEKTQELEAILDARLKEVDAQMPFGNPDYDPDAQPERRGRR